MPATAEVRSSTLRQKLLVLYLGNSNLESRVIAWSVYDGASQEEAECGNDEQPPYASGLSALRDGWRLISYPPLRPAIPGREYELSYFQFEFVFEKLQEVQQ